MAAGRPKISKMTDEEKIAFYEASIQKHKDEIKKLKEKQKIARDRIKKNDITKINEAMKKTNKSAEEIIAFLNK